MDCPILYRFVQGTAALECGDSKEHQNGSGELLRILPIAIYLNDPYSISRSQLFNKQNCLWFVLFSSGKRYYQNSEFAPIFDEHFGRLFKRGFAKLPESEIKSSGYVVHSLEAAIWCLLNTHD